MRLIVKVAVFISVLTLACAFSGCSGTSTTSLTSSASGKSQSTPVQASSGSHHDDDTTDQMFSDERSHEKIYVYQKDGNAYTLDYGYEVDLSTEQPLKDGSYYEVVADITFLNGGIAGYVDFPEIERVYSCKEIARDAIPGSSLFD